MSEIMIKMITLEESEKPYYNAQQKSAPKKDDTNSEYLKCNECNFSCETSHALTKHVDEEHEVAEFCQCKMCKSCFDTKIQLKKHTNTKHLSTYRDDFRFKCKVCNKTFWNGLDLVSHLNDHVAKENIKYTECHDEQFRCKICGTFTSMIDEDIRRHVIIHVEYTLKPKEDFSKDVIKILSPIEEESEDRKIERDEIEESDTSLSDFELYAGFDEDGNRIVEDS
jgi:hypothetical protein